MFMKRAWYIVRSKGAFEHNTEIEHYSYMEIFQGSYQPKQEFRRIQTPWGINYLLYFLLNNITSVYDVYGSWIEAKGM